MSLLSAHSLASVGCLVCCCWSWRMMVCRVELVSGHAEVEAFEEDEIEMKVMLELISAQVSHRM